MYYTQYWRKARVLSHPPCVTVVCVPTERTAAGGTGGWTKGEWVWFQSQHKGQGGGGDESE
eukprot:1105455-Prymnesium_polylepis.1